MKYAFGVHNVFSYGQSRRLVKLSSSFSPDLSAREQEDVQHTTFLSTKIFDFDRRTRHLGVASTVGKEIFSTTSPGLQALEPEEEKGKLLKQIAFMKGILEGMNRYHGNIRGAVLMREKIMLIMFDGADKVLIFSAEPDFSLCEVDRLGALLDSVLIE